MRLSGLLVATAIVSLAAAPAFAASANPAAKLSLNTPSSGSAKLAGKPQTLMVSGLAVAAIILAAVAANHSDSKPASS